MSDAWGRSLAAPPRDDPCAWLERRREAQRLEVHELDLESLDAWTGERDAETIRHASGAFFSIVGVDVADAERRWQQPMIAQPEVGILGLLVAERDGLLHVLAQAKAEPGTVGGVQVAPTVQATRSNFTRRHGGHEVPHVGSFLTDGADGPDVEQSEQGARFLGKRNRNVVRHAGVDPDAVPGPAHAWFVVADLHRALRRGDVVNFDARTALAQLHAHRLGHPDAPDASGLGIAVSADPASGALHALPELLADLDAARRHAPRTRRVPLTAMPAWERRDGRLVHRDSEAFAIAGVSVRAAGREVDAWSQPVVVEPGEALLGLAVTHIDDVLHALLRVRTDPGCGSGAELGPTVHDDPGSFSPPTDTALRPLLRSGRAVFDHVLSAEGGRFLQARQRHLITVVDPVEPRPGWRWVALHQLTALVRRGGCVDEQARSLLVCLLSLMTPDAQVER